MTLIEKAARATELLVGKKVARVACHRAWEVVIFFEDGTHFYVDSVGREDLELSVVDGPREGA
jgi:hypothetical protein